MSPKPTGRARRALKQVLDARRENMEAPQGACPVGEPSPASSPPDALLSQGTEIGPVCNPFVDPQAADRPLPPRPPPAPPRRPELDAWTSPPGPPALPPPLPRDPVHPAHLLRPEQWVLLELITTGMNAAATAQEAYDSAYDNVAQLQSVTRRILAFRSGTRTSDAED